MNRPTFQHVRQALACATVALLAIGCSGDDGGYDSPLLNEDVPVVDIADLPDIEQARSQMLELIERARAEVTKLVPESEPWVWNRDESRIGCTQEATGRKGVMRYTRNLVSDISFTDEQWSVAYPAVERLATEAGLTEVRAFANSTGNREVRFYSGDGRTLVFGSKEASLISATIGCRRPAESPVS